MKSIAPLDPQVAPRSLEQKFRLQNITLTLDSTVEALDSKFYTCNPRYSNTNLPYLISKLQDTAIDIQNLYFEEHSAFLAAENYITNLHRDLANADAKVIEVGAFVQTVSTHMRNASDELIKTRRSLAVTEAENEELEKEILDSIREKGLLETKNKKPVIEVEEVRLNNAELRTQYQRMKKMFDLYVRTHDLMLQVSQGTIDKSDKRGAERERLTRLIERMTEMMVQQDTDKAEKKPLPQEVKEETGDDSKESGQKSWRNCWGLMLSEKDKAEVARQRWILHHEKLRKKEEKAHEAKMAQYRRGYEKMA